MGSTPSNFMEILQLLQQMTPSNKQDVPNIGKGLRPDNTGLRQLMQLQVEPSVRSGAFIPPFQQGPRIGATPEPFDNRMELFKEMLARASVVPATSKSQHLGLLPGGDTGRR